MSTLPDADQTVIWIRAPAGKKTPGRKEGQTLMAKTIFLFGIKDGWLPPISFLFIYYIYFVMEILWRPLVAGEWIGRWMDGKYGKIGLKKKQFCYQLLSSCYQSCYQLLSCKYQ